MVLSFQILRMKRAEPHTKPRSPESVVVLCLRCATCIVPAWQNLCYIVGDVRRRMMEVRSQTLAEVLPSKLNSWGCILSGMTMKRTNLAKSRDTASDDMRPEYDFDYRKARPNRFADRVCKDHRVVILDPDISKVSPTSESVNTVLRALITTMPKPRRAKTARKASSR
jgi:hypothetical protein